MSLFDKLKKKADELHLQEKAEQAKEAAAKAAHQAKEKAGELAEQNKEKVAGALDKATHVIDEKTDGKYHDKVTKATGVVAKGVDKLAEQGRTPGGATPETADSLDATAGGIAPDGPVDIAPPGTPVADPTVADSTAPDDWEPPTEIPPVRPV